MTASPRDVVEFWKEAGPELWFRGGEAFDARCRERFLDLHMAASRGELADWVNNPEGALALILLLDQFPRNIFRGSAHAYATDPLALSTSRRAVELGHDRAFDPDLRSFFYMPYMHSESLLVHEEGVRLFTALGNQGTLDYELAHIDVLRRFGRYPRRNAALGRESTPEEVAYMASGEGMF